MSLEDAEIELGEDEFSQLLKLRIIEPNADGSVCIKFLDDQYQDCLELGNKRSQAAKARWDKAKGMQLHTSALQDNADKIRIEEIREEKRDIPTLQEVEEYFSKNGYTKVSAKKMFEYYEASRGYNGRVWKDGKGNTVKNWKQKARGVWFKDEHLIKPKNDFSFDPDSMNL